MFRQEKTSITIRASVAEVPANLIIEINSKKVIVNVLSEDFLEQTVGSYKLNKGNNKIKILIKSGMLKLDWLRFD